jgi:hypothetical protein
MPRIHLAATLLTAVLVATARPASAETAEAALCRSNPAFAPDVMREVVAEQLSRDHDPSLDATTPDKLAAEAVEQGVADCAADMRRDGALYAVLAGLAPEDRAAGWDAYNTACGDRHAAKGDCVRAELASVQALRRMIAHDTPPGARAIAETCNLVLRSNPPMADWRECVDLGLAAHASRERAAACKLSVTWHVARTGAEAGRTVSDCLRKG